jgi:hypothetical protein
MFDRWCKYCKYCKEWVRNGSKIVEKLVGVREVLGVLGRLVEILASHYEMGFVSR